MVTLSLLEQTADTFVPKIVKTQIVNLDALPVASKSGAH
ncbi:hypothetical protein Ga0080574_TMP759 [Salipiger abyssi]|uniref:Uncharacterized protein n=1 Tax=Salipiger abyssi TaxID=1250539 RepID=A0A1P8UNY3_9RHOB|nr:hypothetical protein Ga0080574_TMP759 [Salipiger abyssi]